MKTAIKLALIGAALVSGAANAANVNTLSNSATGSSLILLMKNYSDTEYFMVELSPTVNDVKTMAQQLGDAPSIYSIDFEGTSPGPLNVPAALNGYTSANLASYLTAADNVGDDIVWTIMGSRTGNGTPQHGQQAFVFTSNVDHFTNYWDNSGLTSASGAMGNFIVSELNGTGVNYVNGVNLSSGWDSNNPIANLADVSFNGEAFHNGASIGTAQSLYFVGSVGDEGSGANVYKSAYTLTLSSAGVLTYDAPPVSEVPVPAAVWLLGSSLMGLLGVGRRRKGTAVVAA